MEDKKNESAINPIKFIKKDESKNMEFVENLTIKELIENADETVIKGNNISITKVDNLKTLNLKITLYPNGRSIEKTEVQNSGLKKELIPTVKQMKNENMTQKEIATKLGISQSYVSQLLKKS